MASWHFVCVLCDNCVPFKHLEFSHNNQGINVHHTLIFVVYIQKATQI